ncbi:MAG TPA: hypothetical protein VG010_04820 [Solirubrobacteraceae bacterium]|jgi:hypothetical protein|nr:hypothetical protein [Solirubrobacteraceae bacterium]
MAVCRIIETRAIPAQYDQVTELLGIGDGPPPGAQLHVAAVADDGTIRVLEVWDSREEAERFTERVRAAREEVGVPGPPSIAYMDVHSLRVPM